MRISGHTTASMFQRYNIVATDDLRAALERSNTAPTQPRSKSRGDAVRTRTIQKIRGLLSSGKPSFFRMIAGAPGGIRTPDLLVRSQTLYPTELRARLFRSNVSLPQVTRAYSKLRPCSTPDFPPRPDSASNPLRSFLHCRDAELRDVQGDGRYSVGKHACLGGESRAAPPHGGALRAKSGGVLRGGSLDAR
jgi:hypothetical protein